MPDPSVIDSQMDGSVEPTPDGTVSQAEQPAEEEIDEEEEWMPSKQQFLDMTTVVNQDPISDNTLMYISYSQLHNVTAQIFRPTALMLKKAQEHAGVHDDKIDAIHSRLE